VAPAEDEATILESGEDGRHGEIVTTSAAHRRGPLSESSSDGVIRASAASHGARSRREQNLLFLRLMSDGKRLFGSGVAVQDPRLPGCWPGARTRCSSSLR
jgi:hypothetical protein